MGEKECVFCAGPLIYANLGLNCCRACAVFYKRAVASRSQLFCLGGANDCSQNNPKTACRPCRLKRIEEALKIAEGDFEPNTNIVLDNENSVSDGSPSTSTERFISDSSGSLLEQLRTHYRSMCHTRLIAEMHARGETPHPLQMSVDDPFAIPATFKDVQRGNKILLSSALEFGNVSFPGFKQLAKRDKWVAITEFFYRFKTFEGCYRANVLFPGHPDRYLSTFTTYIGLDVYEHFAVDLPDNADLEGAYKYITNCKYMQTNLTAGRELIARLNPSHEEFLAVVGLMFWSIGGEGLSTREEINGLADRYKQQILSELHAYYREKLKLDDYATRLGELLMLLQVFDVKDQYKEHLEMLRLLNVIDTDTFVYNIQKE